MWETFHKAHPEVTLVLLPDDAPADHETGALHFTSRDDAESAIATMVRRIELFASTVGVEGVTSAGWQKVDAETARPHAQWHGVAPQEGPVTVPEGDVVAAALTRLGWKVSIKRATDPLWLDATIGDTLARVISTEAGLSIRATGANLLVGQATVMELRGQSDE